MSGISACVIISQGVFVLIGAFILLRISQWLYYMAQISAFGRGIKVPLKWGVLIFLSIFVAIKIFGYELDMEIATIYFVLMLAGLSGILRGRFLERHSRS